MVVNRAVRKVTRRITREKLCPHAKEKERRERGALEKLQFLCLFLLYFSFFFVEEIREEIKPRYVSKLLTLLLKWRENGLLINC